MLKTKFVFIELNLYKVQVIFVSILVHYEQVFTQGINFMKKTLTCMYLPNKEKGEKEGAFYKKVQQMLLDRSPELNTIWKFVFNKSLDEFSDTDLNRYAHKHSSDYQPLDQTNSLLENSNPLPSDASFQHSIDYGKMHKGMENKELNDSSMCSSSATFGMRDTKRTFEQSTNINTTYGNETNHLNNQSRSQSHLEEHNMDFKKNKDSKKILEGAGKSESEDEADIMPVLKILRNHYEVISDN